MTEIATKNQWYAALLFYTGYEPLKVESEDRITTWTFSVPECDVPIVEEEFTSKETSVLLSPFVKAITRVWGMKNSALSNGGRWESDLYRMMIHE